MNENEYGANSREVTDRKTEVLADVLAGKLKYSHISRRENKYSQISWREH
jgi:hypothetical protein